MAIGSTLENLVLTNDADYRRAVVGYGGVFNIFVDTNTSFVLTELEVLPFQFAVDEDAQPVPVTYIDDQGSIDDTYNLFFASLIQGGEWQIRITVDSKVLHHINYRPSISYNPQFSAGEGGIFRGCNIEAMKYGLYLVAFERIEILFLQVPFDIGTGLVAYNDPTTGYAGGFPSPLGFSDSVTNFVTFCNTFRFLLKFVG